MQYCSFSLVLHFGHQCSNAVLEHSAGLHLGINAPTRCWSISCCDLSGEATGVLIVPFVVPI